MSSLTRHSVTDIKAILEHGSSLTNGPIIWSKEAVNSLGGNNTVTFDPYKIANWRRLISEGYSATSTLEGEEWTANQGRFVYIWVSKAYFPDTNEWTVGYSGKRGDALFYAIAPTNVSSFLDRANNAALSKFATQCSQAQHSFQTGTFLGELRETISMIRHPLRGLHRGVGNYLAKVKKLRPGRYKHSSPREVLDAVSDLWLEYSYGWRPFIHDIQDANRAISEITKPAKLPRKTVRAGSEGSGSDGSPSEHSSNEAGGIVVRYSRTQSSRASVRYTGMIQLHVDPIQRAQSILSLDLPSFLPTVWELIPYSFLVDYFSNAGEVITALSNPSALCNWVEKGTLVDSTCSVVIKEVLSPGSGWEEIVGVAAQGTLTKRQVHRGPYTGSLVPRLSISLPNFGLKWLNMGALANSHVDALRSLRLR